MAIRSRRRALLSALAAAVACELDEGATLELVVRADAPAPSSAAPPAQILVGFDSDGGGYLVFSVGFLCAPGAPFDTTVTFTSAVAAGGPTAVDAWLVPVEGVVPPACGPLPAPQRVASPGPPPGAPRTSARAEVLGGCGSGEVRSATLVLGPSR